MASSSSVAKLYDSVIDDVIANSREIIIDEGGDEQVLQELKQIWKKKLEESKALITDAEIAHSKPVSQPHQPVQQITTNVTGAGNVTHQLAMSGDIVQALLQYTQQQQQQQQQGSNDVQRAANNQPSKFTLTVPAHLAQTGLHTYVTNVGPNTQTLQLQPAVFQGAPSGQSNNVPGQQIHYVSLTAEQLRNAQQTLVTPQAPITQLDGADDTSDEDEYDEYGDDNDENDDNDDENQNDEDGANEDEDPLNSGDDVSDVESNEQFDSENVVVCQYDKITRSKNRWKFHLKDGIMHLDGKDYVFHKALGDSEW